MHISFLGQCANPSAGLLGLLQSMIGWVSVGVSARSCLLTASKVPLSSPPLIHVYTVNFGTVQVAAANMDDKNYTTSVTSDFPAPARPIDRCPGSLQPTQRRYTKRGTVPPCVVSGADLSHNDSDDISVLTTHVVP